MQQDDCLFCKITRGDIPSYSIYEDDRFLAILDLFPSHHAQVLVIPREHQISSFTDTDPDALTELVAVGQKIAKQLQIKLPDITRIQVVIEGFEVNHLHLKLYPAKGLDDALTKSGNKASDEHLAKLKNLLS